MAQNAFRRPIHVGTRSFADNEEGAKCIAAFPVFKGETLERVAIDALGITRTDETNADQPPIFSWIAGFYPVVFGQQIWVNNINNGTLDEFIMVLDTQTSAGGAYLGGEPNPSGDTEFMGADFIGDLSILFRRNVIGDPMVVGKDGLDNTDARFIDRFRTVIKKKFVARESGMFVFGCRSYRLDAQTDFGVAEIDASAVPAGGISAIYDDPAGAQAIARPKIPELLFGGDNYIEADSFKETARRQYAIVRPAIRKSKRYGRLN